MGEISRIIQAYIRHKTCKNTAATLLLLYNGREDAPAFQTLRLSDAFINPSPGYEWTAHVYNIRLGKNDELLDKCNALKGYATFVENVYVNHDKGMSLEEAVNKSADDCIKQGLIPEYLTARRGELMQMTLGEIPLEEMKEVWYGEGFEEGEALGESKGKAKATDRYLRKFLQTNSSAKAAQSMFDDLTEDYIKKFAADNGIKLS